MPFAEMYPAIAWWIANDGLIELGHDDYRRSFARALDPGGMVWESDPRYASVNEAIAALEAALKIFMRDQYNVDLT